MRRFLAAVVSLALVACSSDPGSMQEEPTTSVVPVPPGTVPYVPKPPPKPYEHPCTHDRPVEVFGRIIMVPTWCDPAPYVYKGDPGPEGRDP